MVKFIFILLLVILKSGICFGQTGIKDFVISNTREISSISPDESGVTDLDAFAKAVGHAKIVLLGEQEHGDGAAFLAKTRLIKYLVEKQGFSVVACESDFYSLNAGLLSIEQNKDSILSFLQNNIFEIWSQCKQCSPLFNYLSQKIFEKKIKITGIDNQHHGLFFKKKYWKDFYNFLDTSGIYLNGLKAREVFIKISAEFKPNTNQKQVIAALESLIKGLSELQSEMKKKYGNEEFWQQEIFNYKSDLEAQLTFLKGNGYAGQTIRDEQMGNNLAWLAKNKYRNEKIIVWAHNIHVAKKSLTGYIGKKYKYQPMGQVIAAQIPGNDLYALGFTSLKGASGKVGSASFNVPRVKKNSIEDWLSQTNFEQGFIDFTPFTGQQDKFFMKGDINHKYSKENWMDFFDGVFYIKNMFPCETIR
ncbi:MAG: erythromycin esterase family protein [Ferruginibacter sp.]